MGHFERDLDGEHVSAALSAGPDAETCQCSGADQNLQVLLGQQLQPGHFGVGHFEGDGDAAHVSVALSAGADAGTC